MGPRNRGPTISGPERIQPPSPQRSEPQNFNLDDIVNDITINFADTERDILIYEGSDQALEAAAALVAFCSGLDTCPS